MIHSTSKKLFKNFSSLVIVQLANYVLPLIVLPYLTRVIGVEKFGTVAFAQAIIMYFSMLTNFGFNLYGPREISISRGDTKKVTQIFWNIMYSKILLCIVSGLILTLLIIFVPKIRAEYSLYIFFFGYVIAGIFLPVWFFQGYEMMVFIALFNLLMKILYTISVFLFIRQPADYLYVPLYLTFSELIVGILSFVYVIKRFRMGIIIPKIAGIVKTLNESFILFFSNVFISIYTKIPPVLLGFLVGDIYVGFYTIAERIFYGILGIQAQLSTTFYPHISKMTVENTREQTINFIKKTLIITMVISIPLTLIVFIFTPWFIHLIFGKELSESIVILRLLIWLLIIVGLSNVFGIQTMLTFDMKKSFIFPIVTAGIINLILGILLIPTYKHIGAAISFVISECVVTGMMFMILKKKGFNVIPDFNFTTNFILDMLGRAQAYVKR